MNENPAFLAECRMTCCRDTALVYLVAVVRKPVPERPLRKRSLGLGQVRHSSCTVVATGATQLKQKCGFASRYQSCHREGAERFEIARNSVSAHGVTSVSVLHGRLSRSCAMY